MKSRTLRPALLPLAASALLTLVLQSTASAQLGADVSTVAIDRAAFRGQLHTTPLQQYDQHEISLGANSTVREYSTLSGKVFAVSWHGMTPPDLRQLFGDDNFAQFQKAAQNQAQAGMHRQLRVAQSNLIITSSGHFRSFEGHAYIPSLVPAGVNVSALP